MIAENSEIDFEIQQKRFL